jgi:hypothetical protein
MALWTFGWGPSHDDQRIRHPRRWIDSHSFVHAGRRQPRASVEVVVAASSRASRSAANVSIERSGRGTAIAATSPTVVAVACPPRRSRWSTGSSGGRSMRRRSAPTPSPRMESTSSRSSLGSWARGTGRRGRGRDRRWLYAGPYRAKTAAKIESDRVADEADLAAAPGYRRSLPRVDSTRRDEATGGFRSSPTKATFGRSSHTSSSAS